MIWHIVAMIPDLAHILCEHWHGKSLLSSPLDEALLMPHIFETWHSFSRNSRSACPLHPTHLNFVSTYHGNNIQSPRPSTEAQ